MQDITTHLLHHVVNGIRQFGPVYSTWMYPFERFNSWICRRALNRYRPEATIMETYRVKILQNMIVTQCACADAQCTSNYLVATLITHLLVYADF